MKKMILVLSLIAPISAMAFSSLSEQAGYYQNMWGNPPNNYTATKEKSLLSGESRPKAVLKGVFYFGGTDNKKRELLTNNFRSLLCENGFSQAYSVYNKVDTDVKCDGNVMSYEYFGQASSKNNGGSNVRKLMEQLYGIIKSNGSEGPVYLHCWYGVHASNTVAQMVLKQFCGISDETAATNWDKVDLYDGLGPKGQAENIAKIAGFTPYSDLQISAQEKATICY